MSFNFVSGDRETWALKNLDDYVTSNESQKESADIDAGGNVQLPFVIEMKRPGQIRVEIEFANNKPAQVFDATKGWKLRPFLNRRDVAPFTPEELKTAAQGRNGRHP